MPIKNAAVTATAIPIEVEDQPPSPKPQLTEVPGTTADITSIEEFTPMPDVSIPVDNRPLDSNEEQEIRECAYYLWQNAGEPEGADWEFWEQARAKLASRPNADAVIRSNPIDIDPDDSGLPGLFTE